MIYATMCVGESWVTKHKNNINKFAKDNTIHVLTDDINAFPNCITHYYNRDVFSYYEKINHILNLSKNLKQRVTYIDADWIYRYNIKNLFDKDSLYTYRIYSLSESPISKYFNEQTKEEINKTLKSIEMDSILDWYIPEAIISFPYLTNLNEIINDFKKLQPVFEKVQNAKPKIESLYRYSNNGIGYGEGWAITAICIKYDIFVKDFSEFPNKTWEKIGLI